MKTIISKFDLIQKTLIINWNVRKKDLISFATKLIKKIPDPSNSKDYYQSYMKKKAQTLVTRSKRISQQPKTLENLNIVNTKSAIAEHPKTYHKLFKTIKQAEKLSQVSGAYKNSNSPFYSETRQS